MPTQTAGKPYDRLGAFVMFRRLDSDALGETWRAGALEPSGLGPVLATRKLTGNREAWAACFPSAKLFGDKIGGTTLAKQQRFEFAGSHPVVAWEYAGGRSLAHLVAAANTAHNPIPTDQAVAIAEKVVSALESIHTIKQEGKRLVHGALVPQFVWISEDGDVRVAGQLLGKGLIASLSDAAIAKEAGPFVAPELRTGGEPTRHSDVYAAGAIFYLAITGQAPPDGSSGKVLDAVQQAKMMQSGEALPADIKAILVKALATDPAARYDMPGDLHKALSELLNKGQYAPTTFNLAFYLHNLLRSEMETEQKEREREAKIDVNAYLEDLARPAPVAAAAPAPRPQPPAPPPAPMFGTATFDQPKKGGSKTPLLVGAIAIVALAAGGAWYVVGKKQAAPAAVAKTAPPPVTQTVAPAPVAAAPVVAALPGQEVPAATGTDEEARKKAVEEEINRRVAAEMAKVNAEYNKELVKQQEAAAKSGAASTPPVTKTPSTTVVPLQPPPVTAATTPAQQPATATTAPPPVTATQATAPAVAAQQPPVDAPQPAPAARVVQTGDFVASTELDRVPKALKRVAPVYPPMAARQRLKGAVILGLLINENGLVQDVRVLSVDKKGMGFEDAAVSAAKQFTYEPGMKDGKKVKTLVPVPFMFGK